MSKSGGAGNGGGQASASIHFNTSLTGKWYAGSDVSSLTLTNFTNNVATLSNPTSLGCMFSLYGYSADGQTWLVAADPTNDPTVFTKVNTGSDCVYTIDFTALSAKAGTTINPASNTIVLSMGSWAPLAPFSIY